MSTVKPDEDFPVTFDHSACRTSAFGPVVVEEGDHTMYVSAVEHYQVVDPGGELLLHHVLTVNHETDGNVLTLILSADQWLELASVALSVGRAER